MAKKQVNKPYKGKYFYEVLVDGNYRGQTCKILHGPLDTIRYTTKSGQSRDSEVYPFVQIIDGKIIQAFKENEILVTNKIL